jgi:hypothetical protein
MSGEDEGQKSKSFQVVDKRRFDSSGNERSEQVEDSAVQSKGPTTKEVAGEFRMESGEPTQPEVNFSSFVMSLATQAMVQLGQMAPPPGMDIPVDVESGKGTIDILSMLQQKTRGNLSAEEGKFLEDVLHTLRVAYIRRTKPSS